MADRSRAQLAGYAVAAVLLLVAAARLGLFGAHRNAAAPPPPVRVEHGAAAEGGAGGIYVHVAGAVRRPGLYRLSSSARVAMAIRRAGGGTRRAALDGVNLAARVQDGQQVVVPAAGSGSGGGGAGGTGKAGGKVSLGTATAEQLDGLDGIGPTLAKRIVAYRKSHGGLRSIDDLREVEGIGEKRLAALREAVNP
jgi:competence protein ComEA